MSDNRRKAYEPPVICWTEKLEGRAVVCSKADDQTCGPGGDIQS